MTSEALDVIIRRSGIHVAHNIPGRTRLKLERAYRNPQLMQSIAEILVQSLPEVTHFRINPLTGSIVLTHGSRGILRLEMPEPVRQSPVSSSNSWRLVWTGVTLFVELPLVVVLSLAALEIISSLVHERRLKPAQLIWLTVDLLPFVKVPKLPAPELKSLKSLFA